MSHSSSIAIDGRAASRARRHALSAGKAALPPGNDRVRDGSRSAAAAPTPVRYHEPASREPALTPPVSGGTATGSRSCRDEARARRAAHSRHGRGDAPPMPPTRAPRLGRIVDGVDAPSAGDAQAWHGARVTVQRSAGNGHVTGAQRGSALPVSGTQNISADSAAAWCAGGPKVGLTRGANGVIVSGTLVRGKVAVTGDEAGSGVLITGEADGLFDDDVTVRRCESTSPAAQFARQTEPHGHAFAANIARSVRFVGSRVRQRPIVNGWANSAPHGGPPVTGSAGGSGIRANSDAGGAYRAERDGTAFAEAADRITGIDIEQHPRVTGNEPGVGAAVTGSPYHNRRGTPDAAVRAAGAVVTGDTPLHDPGVTGLARGAVRDVTGTPYFSEVSAPAPPPAAPVATLNERFSVASPQRAAQLRAQPVPGGRHITGSFAGGQGKVTGNLEFAFPLRRTASDNPARLRITGEGRFAGSAITGEAWSEQSNVTGTEAGIARNPSRRAGKPQAFSGARRFKTLAHSEEPKHLVTGMFGYSSDSAAKVTLSGGAQG